METCETRMSTRGTRYHYIWTPDRPRREKRRGCFQVHFDGGYVTSETDQSRFRAHWLGNIPASSEGHRYPRAVGLSVEVPRTSEIGTHMYWL